MTHMEVKMNLKGTTRKAMVKAISEVTGEAAVYKFTPTYVFEIGDITVSRYGEIICPDDSDIIEQLKEKGFQTENEPATEQDVVYTETDPYTEGDAGQPGQLSIELPNDLSEGQQGALKALVVSKARCSSIPLDRRNCRSNSQRIRSPSPGSRFQKTGMRPRRTCNLPWPW